MLEIRLLGGFELRGDGMAIALPSRPAQSLLAYLALNAGTAQRRELLAGLLWPDSPEAVARRNLRTALWHLRKALAAGLAGAHEYILADDITIAFNAQNSFSLDAAALRAATNDDCSTVELAHVVSLYRGELLPGFYEDWVILERDQLAAVFKASIQRLLGHLLAEERWEEVLAWSERWIALGGSPEPAYRALMIAHACLGDSSSVAGTFRRCRSALREEMGVEPSAQTVELYERLASGQVAPRLVARELAGTAAPAVHARPEPAHAPPAPGAPPFRGLHYFDEADARLFFGREALTARLMERLRQDPALLLVVGASGSGKSSLLRAGLVPAIKSSQLELDRETPASWRVHIITPTARPLEALALGLTPDNGSIMATSELADALAKDSRSLYLAIQRQLTGKSERVLLVVDQFEELFTLCQDGAQRRAFVDNLLSAAEAGVPLTVLIALRADFYAHCGEYPCLREALADHQEYIGPMMAAELREVIEGPARLGNWILSPGLVDLILNDAGDEPGALPLLSHALLETWKRREGRTLTLSGYAAAGGVRGAIARTAEGVYQSLSPDRQAVMRQTFLRLTALGEGTQDTRRRVETAELFPSPKLEPLVREVLDALAAARLITLASDTAEVAHEAIIREWPTLRRWLAEDREGLRLHRRLTIAAQEWEGMDRDPSVLYRGTQLAQTTEWAEAHSDLLNENERNFLHAAQAQAAGEAAEREAQRLRELEASRQLARAEAQRAETEHRARVRLRKAARSLALALVVATLLAAAAGYLGYRARLNAQAATMAREQTEQQRRVANARELAAASVSSLTTDPERSILLAMQAVNTTYQVDGTSTAEAETALHRALGASRVVRTLRTEKPAIQLGGAFSPDGRRLVTTTDDGGQSFVWDLATGIPVLTLAGHEGVVNGAAYSPDGTRIATVANDRSAKLWDASTGRLLQTLTGHNDVVTNVAFHPGGRMLATASDDGFLILWDLGSGHVIRKFPAGPEAVAFSPDGRLLAGAGDDNKAHIWDIATGEERFTLSGHSDRVDGLDFSPDGLRMVTAGMDATARIWDVATGRELATLLNHTGVVWGARFSPNGRLVLTASDDGTARVWDATSGRELSILAGHEKTLFGAIFSPDGRQVATTGGDGTARIWSVPQPGELLSLQAHDERIWDLAFSPDGKQVATAGQDGTARVWDLATGRSVLTLAAAPEGKALLAASFSPDGRRLATSGQDLEARTWDLETGKQVLSLTGHAGPIDPNEWFFTGIQDIAFSSDGTRIATAGTDATARIWDAQTGELLRTLKGHTRRLNGVRFSPDGARLATAADDFTVRIWDASTGNSLATLAGHSRRAWKVAFSADGQRVASVSQDGTVKVWDLDTMQEQFTLAGHASGVMSVAFSPDGKRLATAGDTTVRVWDAADGRELVTIYGGNSALMNAAFSPDGNHLVIADGNGHLYLDTLQIDELMRISRGRVTRGLTDAECRKYLHVEQCPSVAGD